MDRPTITVLLSTYNGEKFLREQLDSILCQKDVELHLLVRDDGSKDSTLAILNEYVKDNANMTILSEPNIGCEASFEKLGLYAYTQCKTDYYAYADQDDVWFPEKLSKSISAIANEKQPALYCCNQMITDEKLNPMHLMVEDSQYNRLCEVQAINFLKNRHGCVMVWNRPLMDVLGKSKHSDKYTPIHDGWLALLARCSGKVIMGKEPLQYYRVHSANVSGYATGVCSRIKKGVKLYWLKDSLHTLYAADALRSVSQPDERCEGIKYLKKVIRYKKNILTRLDVAFSRQIWHEGISDGIIHSVAVLLGKY